MKITATVLPLLLSCCLQLCACSSTYYAAMEKIGIAKRDLVLKRIIATQESQEATKREFRSALETFRTVVHFDGGSLEQNYGKMKRVLERSEAQAKDLSSRINSVQDVSSALFQEWEAELLQYKSPSLRRKSEEKLKTSKDRYDGMILAMKKAESRLDPALQPLRDNVLYLKHNLNAKAVSSLSGEFSAIEDHVEGLVAALETSIDESQKFIDQLDR